MFCLCLACNRHVLPSSKDDTDEAGHDRFCPSRPLAYTSSGDSRLPHHSQPFGALGSDEPQAQLCSYQYDAGFYWKEKYEDSHDSEREKAEGERVTANFLTQLSSIEEKKKYAGNLPGYKTGETWKANGFV